MAKYEGVVGYVNTTPKFGGYSFTLKGVDGFFKYPGDKKPDFKSLAYVSFECDDRKLVDKSTLKTAYRQDAAPAALPPPGTIKDPRIEADKARQRSIHFQSAHKDAIEITRLCVDKEIVKLPAAQAKKYDVLLALVDELTNRFFTQFENGSTSLPQTEKKQNEESNDGTELTE